ncbi:MAG: diaminopimelate epimerase [Acidobacteria bacterium]|nr:diaminopimelate epimerase [Acidobacteriota bacterium]
MIPFVKAHACGNDFLIVEEEHARDDHAALARRLCARNTSVGADGVEFLERKPDGEMLLRLFNADGSEAELSGNGTRCVAAWLAVNDHITSVTLQTAGGPRTCRTLDMRGELCMIATDMGVPQVMPRMVDVLGIGKVDGADVNVGNPHFVIFTEAEDFSSHGLAWQELGAKICTHPDFPAGTNVEFVRVLAPEKIEFRIYERGVGPTHSSGTGTCASSAASIALRGCDTSLAASSIGGEQQVVWPARDAEMQLTGPAEVICVGKASTGE